MNMRDFDLNLLLVFEAIYSCGNISRAADNLDLSQPAVSNALSRLRKQMDDQLFVRSGNGVVPTLRAEEIIGPVRNALSTLRQSIGSPSVFDPKVSKRHFNLLIAEPLEQHIMSRLLGQIGSDSQISFELSPPQSMPLEEALMTGKTELAVFLMPGKQPELESKPLCPVDLVLVARQDHPRIGAPLTVPELKQEGFVSISLAPGKLANSEKVTFWQRLNLREVCQVYKISSITQFAASTDLLGIVPRLYAEQVAPSLGLQVLELPMELSNQQFYLIWHKRASEDDGLRWLSEQITSCFAEH